MALTYFVKAVSCCGSGKECTVTTASRDGQVKVWRLHGQPPSLEQVLAHAEHASFVNAVAVGGVALGQTEEALCVVSGGTEGLIHVWDIDQNRLLGTLIGHGGNVCFLQLCRGVIYSCSWDRTVRVWQGLHCLQVLEGHSEAVWSCCPMSDGYVLSGSADRTIRLWRDGSCMKIYVGHTDVVRSIASLDDGLEGLGDFASCSNDGTIKFWRLDGECTHTIRAHDSFIYAIRVHRGHLFSAGEDRTLKVWRQSGGQRLECVQAIPLPAVSIWAVDCTAAGEVVCGCSDGRIYVFSPHEALDPEACVLAEFRSRLSSFQVSKVLTNECEVAEEGDLLRPGKKVGETRLVGGDGGTKVYQWDGSKWDKIGDVVEGPATSDRIRHDGKEYDHVFDVELDEGGARLKLPFNNGDNPYAAASRFVAENGLRSELVEQIVDFIVTNTTARTIGPGGELFNPYLNGQHTAAAPHDARYLDANIPGITRKLEEFAATEGDAGMAGSMGSLKKALQAGTTPPGLELIGTLLQAADRWTPERLFPIFDALRVLQLKSAPFASQQMASVVALSRRAAPSGPALLTLGRLVYNLLCDQDCYRDLVGMAGPLCALVEACYSAGLKDRTLPAKLLAGLTAGLSTPATRGSEDVVHAALPLLLTRLRASSDLAELHYLACALRSLFPLLGTRDRKTVLAEFELKQTAVNLGADTIGVIQDVQKLAK